MVLTVIFAPVGFGPIQFRVSEALTLLPFIWPAAVPGLFAGCLIANLMLSTLADAVFGSLATLLAAWWVSRMKRIWLTPLPGVLLNALTIGAVLTYTGTAMNAASWPVFGWTALTVGAGELAAGYGLGMPLLLAMRKWLAPPAARGEGRNQHDD